MALHSLDFNLKTFGLKFIQLCHICENSMLFKIDPLHLTETQNDAET
jgi:hypothetical protein